MTTTTNQPTTTKPSAQTIAIVRFMRFIFSSPSTKHLVHMPVTQEVLKTLPADDASWKDLNEHLKDTSLMEQYMTEYVQELDRQVKQGWHKLEQERAAFEAQRAALRKELSTLAKTI